MNDVTNTETETNTETNSTDTTMTSNDILEQYRNAKKKEWEALDTTSKVMHYAKYAVLSLLGAVLVLFGLKAVSKRGYNRGVAASAQKPAAIPSADLFDNEAGHYTFGDDGTYNNPIAEA